MEGERESCLHYVCCELTFVVTRGALMHGLQGAEAQGPTLERGPTGCREIIFFLIIIYMGVCSSDNSIL